MSVVPMPRNVPERSLSYVYKSSRTFFNKIRTHMAHDLAHAREKKWVSICLYMI
jgi:hypothetical protein